MENQSISVSDLTSSSSSSPLQTQEYQPQRLFSQQDYAVVLLNRKIKLNSDFFLRIWNNAAIRHVIDGGTNHFFDFLDSQPITSKENVKMPDLASGDFDSITPESMRRLKESTACQVIPTEDQDETDFTKGLRVLREHLSSNSATLRVSRVIVICEFTGRLDQIMANMNTLHKNPFYEAESTLKGTTVYLMSASTLTWLLPANCQSIITFERDVPDYTCGLVPFLGPTCYESTGLQWNLTPDMVCSFGGLVSTSNRVKEKIVQIKSCDHNPSIFSVELAFQEYVLSSIVL